MDITTSISTSIVSLLTGAFLARLVYKGKDIRAYDNDMKSIENGIARAERRQAAFSTWYTRIRIFWYLCIAATVSLSAYLFNRG
jgi:hypothetical protein